MLLSLLKYYWSYRENDLFIEGWFTLVYKIRMEIQCFNLFKRHNTNVRSPYDYEVTTELNHNGEGIKHFLLEYLL